ncbi:MAG: glycosyltransferase [Deltaproteobacteria bacterium]|nr:MAG: glycosyltransferase [Deltaproteobacteria bacterium]
MKIAIVAPSPIPFLVGGAEKLFWGLHRHMSQLTSHEVELIKVPCRDQEFWLLMEGYDRSRLLDLSHFDMVISTKYPAWMVPHKNHHLYMQHTCRGVYDLYEMTGYPLEFAPTHRELEPIYKMLNHPQPDRSQFEPFFRELFRLRYLKDLQPETFAYPGPFTRAVIRWLDRVATAPDQIKTYSAISRNVALREGYFPPVGDIEIIHHPSDLEEFQSTGFDYLFLASRLEGLKRIDLLIDAFMSVDADIELRIAGTGGDEEQLKERAAKDKRIRLLGFVNDSEIIRQYGGALFVPFIPYDEDYGLITVEAMQSSKAVLTTLDSGGVNELVRDGHNGRTVAPVAEAIAEAMSTLIADRERTIQMGANGKESVSHINWENTVFGLLREDAPRSPRIQTRGKKIGTLLREDTPRTPRIRTRRKKIVGTTSFRISPPVSGGQKRIYHLHRELARKADSVFVALSGSMALFGGNTSERVTLSPGFVERSVARSREESLHIGELQSALMASIDDIASIDGYRLNPGFIEALSEECSDADLVIASHPYLYHAIRDVYPGRLWYEAQNVEYDLKAAILPDSPQRDEYLKRVREVERQCSRDAELILSVSDGDKARLVELYGVEEKKILIVRNGMDFRAAASNRLSADEKRRLKQRLGFGNTPIALFIGSYHGPNIEALRAIKEIARQCPEFLFLVMGSVCDHEEANQAPVNVKPLGVLDEDEKNVLLNAADIALNPILSGSGSNLKLLEYIAYGIPVITTSHGNRGYGLQDKEHLLVAEADDFSKIISHSLSADSPALRRMVETAKQFASSRYDWSVIAASLLNYFA